MTKETKAYIHRRDEPSPAYMHLNEWMHSSWIQFPRLSKGVTMRSNSWVRKHLGQRTLVTLGNCQNDLILCDTACDGTRKAFKPKYHNPLQYPAADWDWYGNTMTCMIYHDNTVFLLTLKCPQPPKLHSIHGKLWDPYWSYRMNLV